MIKWPTSEIHDDPRSESLPGRASADRDCAIGRVPAAAGSDAGACVSSIQRAGACPLRGHRTPLRARLSARSCGLACGTPPGRLAAPGAGSGWSPPPPRSAWRPQVLARLRPASRERACARVSVPASRSQEALAAWRPPAAMFSCLVPVYVRAVAQDADDSYEAWRRKGVSIKAFGLYKPTPLRRQASAQIDSQGNDSDTYGGKPRTDSAAAGI